MAYLIGVLFGIVWLWFWLRGNWFAALVGALPLALAWFVLSQDPPGHVPAWVALVCLIVPWVPMMAWMLNRPSVRRHLTAWD